MINVPGMSYADVKNMSGEERMWYCHRLIRHMKEEKEAWEREQKKRKR